MRTCPKCKKEIVADDGYCAGWCREIVMEPLNAKATTAVAGAAICSAASSKEPERDESDCAPYWLCYEMAGYFEDVPCERAMQGGDECHNSADCITEWCAPCAAKAWLQEQKRLSAPLPPNEKS